MKLSCRYLESCRGCPLGHLEFDQQKEHKKRKFKERLQNSFSPTMLAEAEFAYVFPVFNHYRTRVDFVYGEGHLGWYDQQKKFLPIEDCPLHTRELSTFAKEVVKITWPIQRGSMRLRISPEGIRGVWLDLANLDIKQILSDATALAPLFDDGVIIEMGQKGKRVIRLGESFKLSDPTPYPWFKTEFKNTSVFLNSLISSFTQTNPELNIQMIGLVKSFFKDQSFDHIVEFGGGVGNFTLFLSDFAKQMTVIENDFRNLIPLRINLKQNDLTSKVKIFENVNTFLRDQKGLKARNLYFVNPARSGVGPLFDSPVTADHVIYISCHLDSFVNDTIKLGHQGFKLKKAILFDQFPNADHFEILSHFVTF